MTSGMQLAALGAFSAILVALGAWIVLSKRPKIENEERHRRRVLNERGRFGDAFITEVTPGMVFYTYSVQGVQYTASQDVSMLSEYMPPEAERLIGPAGMKYSSNNPGNSILICEEWSGLRPQPKSPQQAQVEFPREPA
jgi:hypothetical protein